MTEAKREKRIVGIDPGSVHLGFGCVQKSGNKIRLIHAEIINASPKDGLYDRLKVIRGKLHDLLDLHSPHEVALEKAFAAKNIHSAFYLGLVRGVVFSACLERCVRIYEYAPTQVKSVVTGSGRADKEQVKRMVGMVVGQTELLGPLGYDATDAVAIALCHAFQNNFELPSA